MNTSILVLIVEGVFFKKARLINHYLSLFYKLMM